MHGDAIHGRIGTAKVDKLKDIGRVRSRLDNLAKVDVAALFDKDGLAGLDVNHVGEAQLAEGNGLGGEEVVLGTLEGGGWAGAQAERSDAVGVSEAEDTEAGDHGCAGKAALALFVDVTQGNKDVVGVDSALAELIERVGKDVEPVVVSVNKCASLLHNFM